MLATYSRLLPRYRNYFLAAALFFILGIALGVLATLYYPQAIEQVFQSVGGQLEQLGKAILTKPLYQGILILFWHNLRAALLVLLLGPALGIYPMLAMLLNGMIIGIIGVLSIRDSSLFVFLAGVLPHGIMEIPALLLGTAIGLRLGLGPLVAKRKSPFATPRLTAWQGYGQELKDALALLPLLILLFALAAVVEVAITPQIIQALT